MRLFPFLVLAMLAGCAEAPDTAPMPEPEPVEEIVEPVLTIVEVADPLTNLTEFHWGIMDELGNAAFEVTVDFGGSNDCSVAQGVGGTSTASGTHSVAFNSRGGWSSGGGGAVVSAKAGPISTDDVLGSGGRYASASGTGGTFSGEVTFTRVAVGIGPTDFTDMLSGMSLTLSIECSSSFDVLSARLGREVELGGFSNVDGAALDAFLIGGAGAGSASLDISEGDGHVRFGSFGTQAGGVVLASPDETLEFVLPVEEGGALASGPGTYSVELVRGGAYFEAYWHTIYNLSETVDLTTGILSGPAYRSPF